MPVVARTAPRRRAPRERAPEGALAALLLLPVLGAVLAVSLLRPFAEHAALLIPLLVLASLAWLAALALARGGGVELRVVVAGAVALRLLALAGGPELSDDAYRYLVEGELVARGVSPYAHAPADPVLERFRAAAPELYARVNHPEISAVYPPLAQASFAALHALAEALELESLRARLLLVRAAFAACDLLVLAPLVALLRRRGLPAGLALAWGWSPLVALSFGGSGHYDALAILLLVGALALHARGVAWRSTAATVLLAAAALVKLLPAAAAPFVARQEGMRRGTALLALLLGLVALGYGAVVLGLEGGATGMLSGPREYGLRWESASLVVAPLERGLGLAGLERDLTLLDVRRVARALVLGAWLALALVLLVRRTEPARASFVLVGAFLVLTPTLHPWYVTWVLPLAALFPGELAFRWLAASSVLLYAAPALLALEGRYEVPLVLRLAIGVPFAALLARDLSVARRPRR